MQNINTIAQLKKRGIPTIESYLRSFLNEPNSLMKYNIDETKQKAIIIVKEVMQLDTVYSYIEQIRLYDEITYCHSLNVSLYATMIGLNCGFNVPNLIQLAMAGLLHDIGKEKIDLSIINKPGKLTKNEFRVIQKHPVYAHEILSPLSDLSIEALNGILHHHEKEDGTGYPDHLQGEDIGLFAKILHIADVYDALIAKRPYKDPYSPSEAVENIMGDPAFDVRLKKIFIESVPAYEIGEIVQLSDGQVAQVIKNHNNLNLRPTVNIGNHEVNLASESAYLDVTIIDKVKHLKKIAM